MENTAKNFALQLGSLVALYISLGALITLLFGIINNAIPDAVDDYYMYESTESSMRFAIALLVVFFPTYIGLTRYINTIRRQEQGAYLNLTKWLIYLSLLVGGAVLLGDLVAVINEFLNGELTTRFTLKALSLLIIIGAAFFYYFLDARNYWQSHEKQSIQYGAGVSVVVIAALVYGFIAIDSPEVVRQKRLDQEQIVDLDMMQWRIAELYRITGKLPADISEVFATAEMPQPPEGRTPYEYRLKDSQTFTLCATFAEDSSYRYGYGAATDVLQNPSNWEHTKGRVCFDRFVTSTPATGGASKPMVAPLRD